MARFDRLEFGEPAPEESKSQKDEPRLRDVHDERRWLKDADTCRRRGQYENALRYYSRALEENKALVSGWIGQVQMLVLLDEVPEADLWARKALEVFPGNGELLAARAQALCRLGDKKQAIACCDGSMSAQGRSAYRWQVRGELMVATRQTMDAHCFDKAQQIDRDWLVPLETALIYLHYDLASKAQGRARAAVEQGPGEYYCWYVNGCAQAVLGFSRQARESLDECLKLCPKHADAISRLSELDRNGSMFSKLGRWFKRG